jgi:hypothetical protein
LVNAEPPQLSGLSGISPNHYIMVFPISGAVEDDERLRMVSLTNQKPSLMNLRQQ